jgi:hypothetical protein
MPDEIVPQNTLREQLESSFNEVEQAPPQELGQPRDEVGRFAPKPKEEAKPAEPQAAQPAQQQQPQWAGPSTWKKEYRPLYDKLANGQPLTADEAKKLAQYTNERENDFKTGVSTYKSEAMAAKELQEAITPFLPELKANGLNPGQWIRQLGQAHYALAKGTPELKLQVFRELARQFNVPLAAVMQNPQQVPPIVNDLLGQIQELKQQVSGVASWRQQQEQTSLTSEIAKYANDKQNYPHFEAVRGTMAQLLESGLAQDIPTAYAKAVWMQDDTREAMQQALAPKPNPAAKAKARAVSPKSATPSGQVQTGGAKDRRAVLSEAFDAVDSGRV